MRYLVIAPHRSAFPHPLALERGQALEVGERYQGTEAWDDWYLCRVPGQAPGWVPAQMIGRDAQGRAFAQEAYCARELDVDPDQALLGRRVVNGWAWCVPAEGGVEGWVPLRVLQAIS